MSAPSWMRRLDRPGRVLAPLPGCQKGFGVFAGSDRRRRPFARAGEDEVRAAVSDGVLVKSGQGWGLSEAGRQRLARLDSASDQPFAAQHQQPKRRIVMGPDGERSVMAASAPGPLARYLKPSGGRSALLEAVHASAAAIFVRDYERSALSSRVTADWSAPPGGQYRSAPGDRADIPAMRLDAQARVLEALEEVGPGLDRLVFAILIRETGMGAAERALDWPERAGAAMLKIALDRLAVHYRLKPRPAAYTG
jgi:hypothetical protein